MRTLCLLILAISLNCVANAQTTLATDINSYDYDLTLKGGYSILYEPDDSLQRLFLIKNTKTIAEIASISRGLPHKNLGYVGADFEDYFVLVHSFGSGNPHFIELIQKTTGKNILNNGSIWIGVDTIRGVLLYSKGDASGKAGKMTLLEIKGMKQKEYPLPEDIFDGSGILQTIELTNVTKKTFTIEYANSDRKATKRKTYIR